MAKGLRMRAAQSLPAVEGRKAVARNAEFSASNPQEARDLWQRGHAEYVSDDKAAAAAKPAK